VLQISSFLADHGLDLEEAFHHPRIDASETEYVALDPRLPAAVRKALAAKFTTRENELVVYPTHYACPSAVLRDTKSRENFGMSDVMSPWSGAVAESDA
jgi:gamma-glutamyltranspeptidase/glutathione hydrolase